MSSDLLEVQSLSVRYGGLQACDDVSLAVAPGQIVGLIGPNGAGKTSFIDAVAGFTRSAGSVHLGGRRIDRLAPHRRARLGLCRTFQSLELFESLSVRDNVMAAADNQRWWSLPVDLVRVRSDQREHDDHVDDVLRLLGLADVSDRLPGELSHGQRKLVGVARALASRPRLVMLDEPAAGLDTTESKSFGDELRKIAGSGCGLLLVDHDVGLVFDCCDQVVVLEFGRVIARGSPAQVREDPTVVHAYLGERRAATLGDRGLEDD